MIQDLSACAFEKDGHVATIRIFRPKDLERGTADLHWELGEIFSALRGDKGVRAVILTGSEDLFYAPRDRQFYETHKGSEYLTKPTKAWETFTGIVRTHMAMAELEKPIVARVNGHAVGFGSSLVLACDFIVAVKDATIVDMHLGMGEVPEGGPSFGVVPGDGGAALVPLFMPPTMAKEYLMLAKRYKASELRDRGIVNYAVEEEDLDAKVDDLVAGLLRRPSYALAWTKRVVNRHLVNQLNMTLDAGAAYEMVNFLQLERNGWKNDFDL